MESKYSLFDIGSNLSFPFWDMIRVSMYNGLIANVDQSVNVGKRLSLSFFKEHLGGFFSIFKRNRIIIVCDPRYKYDEIHCFDRISHQLTEMVEPSKRSVIYVCPPPLKPVFRDDKYNFWITMFRLCVRDVKMEYNAILKIKTAFKDFYNIDLDINDLVELYKFHYKKSKAYCALLKIIKPLKIICACDQQKHIIYAGKKLGIPTYEMQHAGIMFDYPSYSYPSDIKITSNHAFANHYMMFGDKWGEKNNIPTQRMVIGNDFYCPSTFVNHFKKHYIVLISDCVHTELLKDYAIQLAKELPDYLIVYKLHPSERQNIDKIYSDLYKLNNIQIVADEIPLWDLLKYMDIMILVYSSTFFEAASLGKKIAVIRYDNSYLLEEFSDYNVFFVERPSDILNCMECAGEGMAKSATYYVRFNQNIAKKIIND